MRRTYRKKKYKPDKTQYRANEKIRVPEVRLIDEKGEMLGVMPTKEALALARERKLDLVEVNPTDEPPLAKFMDFGKMQYEKEKLKQKQKASQKVLETKGVRLSFRMSEHDLETRKRQAVKFLEKGHKVKSELIVKGRENAFLKQAFDKATLFLEQIQEATEGKELVIEQAPKKEGHRITTIVYIKK